MCYINAPLYLYLLFRKAQYIIQLSIWISERILDRQYAILETIENLKTAIDENKIRLDFSNAYDTIIHNILLVKMNSQIWYSWTAPWVVF